MQQILFFFQKFKYFLFFLFLEFIALTFIFNNLNFHKSKFVNSANSITGRVYTMLANSSEYFKLKTLNEQLSEENTRLKNLLAHNKLFSTEDSIAIDTTKYYQKYSNYLKLTILLPCILIASIWATERTIILYNLVFQ